MIALNAPGSLAAALGLRPGAVRSVNIERDRLRPTVTDGYVFTAQARRSLDRICDQLEGALPVRAWTLTGPYGSGKSLFALYLMALFTRQALSHERAMHRLQEIDPLLAAKVADRGRLSESRGLLPVPITASRAPLQVCVQRSLLDTLHGLQEHRSSPAIRQLVSTVESWNPQVDSRTVVSAVTALSREVTGPQGDYSGILLVVDELGKALEFAAAHPDESDIYLLQELAEHANRSGSSPLLLLGILHQGFDNYAGRLDVLAQREWAKIQGRFEDITFYEPPAQQMRLLADALAADNAALRDAQRITAEEADRAFALGWAPTHMSQAEFRRLCARAYPFHPTALVALPHLFRRLAQNERSLFGYLASHEPCAFQEFLAKHDAPDFLRLPHLFDYLVANYAARLQAGLRARAVAEAQDRLDANPAMSPAAAAMVKTIGLLTWLSENAPVAANRENLFFAVGNSSQYGEALNWLEEQSLIVHRRFNDTYVVWQGSDVDLNDQVENAQRRLSRAISAAQTVQSLLPAQPVVARRHSFQTGALRYFAVRYIDALTYEDTPLDAPPGAAGVVLLGLVSSPSEAAELQRWAESPVFSERLDVVVAVAQHTARLVELVHELRALDWVQDNTPELRSDSVARREMRLRLNAIETALRNELDATLQPHRLTGGERCRWFWRGGEVLDERQLSLSHLISRVCDALYPAGPVVRNELINRRTLSSQAAAARRNLIEAMLLHSEEERLGIEGFPPERSMYDSILRAGGLHHKNGEGDWEFGPPPDADPLHISPLWRHLDAMIFSIPPALVSVDSLLKQLDAPPYGVLAGVAPVLLCAFLQVHHHEVTLYREGTLLPEPTIADWEVLLRRPELFTLAGCRITGARAAIAERLARSLQTKPAAMPLVRNLIRRVHTLPEHAWRTQRLSPATLAMRKALESARSPELLLFVDLPAAFDLPPFEDAQADPAAVRAYFAGLNAGLQELNEATPRAIRRARDELLIACGLEASDDGWQQLCRLAAIAPDGAPERLAPFLLRADPEADSQTALESVLAFVATRPPAKWTDADCDRFSGQAKEMGKLFRSHLLDHKTVALTPAEEERSRMLAERLKDAVPTELRHESRVVREALRRLMAELVQAPALSNSDEEQI